MNTDKMQLTQQGFDELKRKLERLKKVERVKNLEDIIESRAQGDLSENADYAAAKDRQGEIEREIKEVEMTLKNSVVITSGATNLGKRIKYEVLGLDDTSIFGGEEEKELILVSSIEANPFDAIPKISNECPLGIKLMHAEAGKIIDIESADVRYKILVKAIQDRK